jgi:hypothetical protein
MNTFVQRRSTTVHGTLGSYLRDALQEDSADAVACFPVPRAYACGIFSSFYIIFLVYASRGFHTSFIRNPFNILMPGSVPVLDER